MIYRMAYFTSKTIEFFEHLAGHNHKDRFDENRQWYHDNVKDPFDAYLRDLIAEVRKDDKSIMIEPKHAKFRINRDIRFSKDKTPYKLHVSWVISQSWRKDMSSPGIYVHFGHDGVHFATWVYSPNKEQLHAIRSYIMKHPKKFKTIISAPKFTKIFGELQWQKNKRIPKIFQEKAIKIPELYNKQFYFYSKHLAKEMIRKDLINRTMQYRFASKDWRMFMRKALISV